MSKDNARSRSERSIEKEIEERQDVEALKRVAEMKRNKSRFDKAVEALRKERKEMETTVEAAEGLRRPTSTSGTQRQPRRKKRGVRNVV